MEIIKTGFNGLLVIEPDVFADKRGYFFESFNAESYRKAGIDFIPVQDNESRSSRGVIRGLHYQLKPHDQAKLIRVIEGKIFDVALDIRKESPTYGKWFGIELDSESKKQLFIPRGFAHGFSVLSEVAVILYKVDCRSCPGNRLEAGDDNTTGKRKGYISPGPKQGRQQLLKQYKWQLYL